MRATANWRQKRWHWMPPCGWNWRLAADWAFPGLRMRRGRQARLEALLS